MSAFQSHPDGFRQVDRLQREGWSSVTPRGRGDSMPRRVANSRVGRGRLNPETP